MNLEIQGRGGNDTLSIGAGANVALLNDPGSDGTQLSATVGSSSTLIFGATSHLANLTIQTGGLARMAQDGTHALILGSLSLAFIGTFNFTSHLDLTDNDLIVRGGSLSLANAQINHQGIYSSNAVAGPLNGPSALGVSGNGTSYSSTTMYSVFDGQSVTKSDVLIKYTYPGDANLNGTVDSTDQTMLQNALQTAPLFGWYDYNYDGVYNSADTSILNSNLGKNPPSQGSITSDQAASGYAPRCLPVCQPLLSG